MIENKAITQLKAGIVVDQSKIVNLSANDLGKLMSECYASNSRVVIVDNFNKFFTSTNLIELLKSSDRNWALVAEKFNLVLSVEQVDIMQKSVEIQKEILEFVKGIKTAYEFAEVPAGWTVENSITFKGISVRRLQNGSTTYSIGVKTLENLWLSASKYWAKVPGAATVKNIHADSYNKNAHIRPTHIDVGCQVIQRYEIEQVALHRGWEFP